MTRFPASRGERRFWSVWEVQPYRWLTIQSCETCTCCHLLECCPTPRRTPPLDLSRLCSLWSQETCVCRKKTQGFFFTGSLPTGRIHLIFISHERILLDNFCTTNSWRFWQTYRHIQGGTYVVIIPLGLIHVEQVWKSVRIAWNGTFWKRLHRLLTCL